MKRTPRSRYEAVIGLEVHTHLRTHSKLFSPAPVSYGDEPNHSVHLIDLGLPGVLPVLNEGVVDLAIRLGLATHCSVNPRSDRSLITTPRVLRFRSYGPGGCSAIASHHRWPFST